MRWLELSTTDKGVDRIMTPFRNLPTPPPFRSDW